MIRHEKHISKDFYKHTETGQIFVIERRCDGLILGSCAATEPLKDLDAYECKPDRNIWLIEDTDKLIMT